MSNGRDDPNPPGDHRAVVRHRRAWSLVYSEIVLQCVVLGCEGGKMGTIVVFNGTILEMLATSSDAC